MKKLHQLIPIFGVKRLVGRSGELTDEVDAHAPVAVTTLIELVERKKVDEGHGVARTLKLLVIPPPWHRQWPGSFPGA